MIDLQQTVYVLIPKRKAIRQNGKITLELQSIQVVRKKLLNHMYNFVPKILTPYGMAPDCYLSTTGNGLYSLNLWSKNKTLAPDLPRERAEGYLFGHYLALFGEVQNTWKNYWSDSIEAFNQATILLAEHKNISETEARKLMKPKEIPPVYQLPPDSYISKYQNIIPPLQGESYKDTIQRLSNALDEKLPTEQFFQLVKHIRSKR